MENLPAIMSAVGVAIGFTVGVPLLVSRQTKKAAQVEALLLERGPMTLDEIAKAVGTSVFAKGYLMQALNRLAAQGKFVKVPPPKGHPALRIIRDTKFHLPSG